MKNNGWIEMIPRMRPFFNENYIEVAKNWDPNRSRDEYSSEISKKLKIYYPNARKFEFINLGRSSLRIALDILNIAMGDEIILPCFNYPLILEPIRDKKIKPLLVDVNFDFSIDLHQMREKISKKTKAVLVPYLFGMPGNILEVKEIADEYGIYIIEDCAHVFCSEAEGIKLGSIGDIAFTSFRTDKPLSIGRGSALIVNNNELMDRANDSINNLPLNPIIEEKIAFLSFLYFYINTKASIYNDFLDIDDGCYHYLKKNLDIVDYILLNIDKEREQLLRFKFYDKHKNFCMNKLYRRFETICQNPKKDEPLLPMLLNLFSMNLLTKSIKWIDKINENRIAKSAIYSDRLRNNQDIIAPVDLLNTPLLRYSIICKNPKMTKKLNGNLVGKSYEVGNFNWDKTLNSIVKDKYNYEKSEFISKNIINLPNHMYIKNREIHEICDIINGENGRKLS
jgi:dTDP-4-amino-4,6-dideoxygalactose transaminase